jgi:hypothetical protein
MSSSSPPQPQNYLGNHSPYPLGHVVILSSPAPKLVREAVDLLYVRRRESRDASKQFLDK